MLLINLNECESMMRYLQNKMRFEDAKNLIQCFKKDSKLEGYTHSCTEEDLSICAELVILEIKGWRRLC